MSDADDQQQELEEAVAPEAEAAIMPVVGIGVCAVSLRSVESLFAGISPSLGAAYLVAVRQQEGLDVGSLRLTRGAVSTTSGRTSRTCAAARAASMLKSSRRCPSTQAVPVPAAMIGCIE